MNQTLFFPPPEPVRERRYILPVFLPFSGCPQRCVFCAQDIQTGETPSSVRNCLERAGDTLEGIAGQWDKDCTSGNEGDKRAYHAPLELAFFGGTFTALPEKDFASCLDFAAYWRARGIVGKLRCSTRPDAVTAEVLQTLSGAGFSCVELGVQSFSDKALAASHRGYDGQTARQACGLIADTAVESGIALGIQLLPGMPGHDVADALEDVRQSIALKPAFVRLYPCLVLEGTVLAGLWREGRYSPWALDATVDFLARACRNFQEAGIAVIRMGLAEEPGLDAHVLAGPRHPSLGGMARSRALYLYVKKRLQPGAAPGIHNGLQPGGGTGMVLYVPRRFQGEFWGHRGELVALYGTLGLTRDRVRWHDEDSFVLEFTPARDVAPGTRYP